tara:strand:- start:740 stop:1063 length:324 start_codon:yes stop_codon:yes gene_type:complete
MTKMLDALLDTLEKVKNPKDVVAVIHSAFDETPHVVAFVDVNKTWTVTEKLEFAFEKTNNINNAWWENKEVTKAFDGDSCRSTSVGDAILIGTDKYMCEAAGWSDPI